MTNVGTWIGLLGPLELRRAGDSPVTVSGAKQRALLGALALDAGQVLSIDALVDEMWEDEPPPSAAHTLEANISRLRPALATVGMGIARRGAGYVLDVGGATLDVERRVAHIEHVPGPTPSDAHADRAERRPEA